MKLFSHAITVVEMLMLGALVVLELLAGYKAGVMQHLYFTKIHYLATLYSSEALVLHFGAILLCTVVVVYRSARVKPVRLRACLLFAIFCLLFLLCSLTPLAKSLSTYAHLLIFLECCIALEVLRIIVVSKGTAPLGQRSK
ncbi:hypothetical protein [Desulforhopalus sp. IMCC35007]|uniref:hypothetical protein n=1 Tax=Desulforhopalus sp. IMCC35007 TaxID=2569543 RepID=UPI0010ADA7A3|nr:hypothetical protein [Desulforhopalus sp. IMCC35007]TKB11572.1 hypothetical protein FCL48_01870 [Desulforhopalus sp. IMCC35007]